MRRALLLLMAVLWVVSTSSHKRSRKISSPQQPSTDSLGKSLDSLNNSLNRLKSAVDESN